MAYAIKPNAIYTCVDGAGGTHKFHGRTCDTVDDLKQQASEKFRMSIMAIVAEERLHEEEEIEGGEE